MEPGFLVEPSTAVLPAVVDRAPAVATGPFGEVVPGGRAERRRAAQARSAAQEQAREQAQEQARTQAPGQGTGRRRATPPQGSALEAPEQPRALTAGSADAPAPGGRAARRKAEQARQRGGRGARGAAASAGPAGPDHAGRAARRKAARPSVGSRVLTASARVVGEAAMTVGVLLVLYVIYLTWWTNVVAAERARDEANDIQQQWKDTPGQTTDPRDPGNYVAPNKGFALMYIPRIGMEKQAIAQGTDRDKVLNKGLVGHYTNPQTAMPWDTQGNFAVAAHRNGHGEPFRWVNKLQKGDHIVVETATTYYTYVVDGDLPQTSPSHIEVIDPIPDKGPYKSPGRYITLTTCTPDGASTYRLIVWGHLAEERPRAQGKPDALLDGNK